MGKHRFGSAIWGSLFTIILFLILIGVLNIVADEISNAAFLSAVDFLNESVIIIILISVVMLLGTIFQLLVFPFNMFYPLFNAVGGILFVEFIFKILVMVDSYVKQDVLVSIIPLYPIALAIVTLIILIVGYFNVFSSLLPDKEKVKRSKKERESIDISPVGEKIQEEVKSAASSISRTFGIKKKVKVKRKK